jgi:DNA-binding FrmR family transcriptional regulator
MDKDCKKLIDHISRLEGQLAAVKKEILNQQTDCIKASKVILAASRSFATLRMTFIKTFLQKKYLLKASGEDEIKLDEFLSIIKG